MDLLKVLNSHRSIRKFKPKKIDEHLFQQIILAGQSSASSSFIQACTIIRIKDLEKRKALRAIAGDQSYVEEAPEFLVFCADLSRSYQCCEYHNKEAIKGLTEQFIIATVDTAIVAQSTVIAAEALGLGICYIGALRNDPLSVSNLLDLPDYTYPVFGLCLGYPDENPEFKPRLPIEIFLKDDVYKDKNDMQAIASYDEDMLNYYEQRTTNKKHQCWSEQMAGILSKESRPFMKEYLAQKGFLKR
jgi:nitroreductase